MVFQTLSSFSSMGILIFFDSPYTVVGIFKMWRDISLIIPHYSRFLPFLLVSLFHSFFIYLVYVIFSFVYHYLFLTMFFQSLLFPSFCNSVSISVHISVDPNFIISFFNYFFFSFVFFFFFVSLFVFTLIFSFILSFCVPSKILCYFYSFNTYFLFFHPAVFRSSKNFSPFSFLFFIYLNLKNCFILSFFFHLNVIYSSCSL